MLSKFQIKEHSKYAVYTHLFSCFAVVFLSTLIPTVVLSAALSHHISGFDMNSINFTDFLTGALDASSVTFKRTLEFIEGFGKVYLFYIFAELINLPFKYCVMRYFLVLSGTPADRKCSFAVFFSGSENISAFLKGAFVILITDILSAIGIIVGYFPIYLALCMAPFYIAIDGKTGVFKALSKSRALMKGNKMAAFSILLEFILVRLGASLLSSFGLGFISLIIDTMAYALFNTTLAVIFVRLDRAKNETASLE